MGVISPRNRVITFRLSVTEYERVSEAAERSNARSLSDFARGAVLDRAQMPKSSVPEHEQLRVLGELFQILIELKQLVGELTVGLAEAKVT